MASWAGSLLLLSAALTCAGSDAQECGVAPLNTRVVGGGDATAGSWPWQVSVHKNGNHICGGTVISNQWVLTAAHCFDPSPASVYTVYLGRDSQAGPNPDEVITTSSEVVVHPYYNNSLNNNDIALMKLSSPVTFTDHIRPVCLASNSTTVHNATSCWATGWGRTRKDEPLPASSSLQEVEIPVLGNKECACAFLPVLEANITARMICAGQRGKGVCQGDSGGPLQCKQGSSWIQTGVTSFGVPCAVGFPEVYSRVSEFQSWITQQVDVADVNFVTFTSSGADPDDTFVCSAAGPSHATGTTPPVIAIILASAGLLRNI